MQARVIIFVSNGQILPAFVDLITSDFTAAEPHATILPLDFFDQMPNCAG